MRLGDRDRSRRLSLEKLSADPWTANQKLTRIADWSHACLDAHYPDDVRLPCHPLTNDAPAPYLDHGLVDPTDQLVRQRQVQSLVEVDRRSLDRHLLNDGNVSGTEIASKETRTLIE